MGAAQGVVFLGGHPTKLMAYAVEELLTWYPFMPVEKSMQVNRLPTRLQPPGRHVRVQITITSISLYVVRNAQDCRVGMSRVRSVLCIA